MCFGHLSDVICILIKLYESNLAGFTFQSHIPANVQQGELI